MNTTRVVRPGSMGTSALHTHRQAMGLGRMWQASHVITEWSMATTLARELGRLVVAVAGAEDAWRNATAPWREIEGRSHGRLANIVERSR